MVQSNTSIEVGNCSAVASMLDHIHPITAPASRSGTEGQLETYVSGANILPLLLHVEKILRSRESRGA
jgi:hypothetical protein